MGSFDINPLNAKAHPSRFVGPTVAGALVQALEMGILINQFFRFWSRANDEHRVVKCLVAFVSLAAAIQTAIGFYNTWRVTVEGYGDWFGAINLQWYDRIQPGYTCTMATPVQAFLIWRCWNAMKRRWIILIPLASLLVATVVVNTLITLQVFSDAFILKLLFSDQPLPLQFITAYVLSAVLDILITSLMLWFLIRARSEVVSRRFDKIIGRLLVMSWEAAVPPCACAIAACVVYITMSTENFWDLFLQSVLGKLYVISLFVILNGRADLKYQLPQVALMNPSAVGLTRYWMTGAEVRVNLSTIVDDETHPTTDMDMTPRTETFEHARPGSERPWDKTGDMRERPWSSRGFDLEKGFGGCAEGSRTQLESTASRRCSRCHHEPEPETPVEPPELRRAVEEEDLSQPPHQTMPTPSRLSTSLSIPPRQSESQYPPSSPSSPLPYEQHEHRRTLSSPPHLHPPMEGAYAC